MDTTWDPRAERMSPDERAALQARRLDELLGRLAERSPLYRERLGGAGVGPGGRVGLDGLAELPFTTKQDLWDGYPWGLLAVPREQVLRGHGSSGTGGRPTLVAHSRAGLELWAQVCALVVDRTGAMPRLVAACELAAGWSICAETEEAERERVAAEVGAALGERLGLATEVRVLPGGTIPRVELGKAVRVAQRTADHDPLPGWL